MEMFLLIIAIIAYCAYKCYEGMQKGLKLQSYNTLLQELRKDSSSAELKTKALAAGRQYYASLRDDGKVTIYDEQALNNDITNACGSVNNATSASIPQQIEQLAGLKEKGILTEDEFNAKKEILLSKI